jgi:DNA primase
VAIPQNFIQDLLTRADVVEVVGRHVQLRKAGANYSGLCPFHGEKTPSFTVSPSKQFYHCFGCGKNGNAIGFLMDHTGASFVEAVQDLAQQYGMIVPEDDRSPQDRIAAAQQREKQDTLVDVLEKTAIDFQAQLKRSERAIGYFKGRGLTGEIAKRFGLGYAPPGWRHLASVFPDYQSQLLVESGLVIEHADEGHEEDKKRYDRFRDRVMFPIRNVKGQCIGFGGRVLDSGEPKYLNSPETPVFSKGRELYGLFEARDAMRDAGYVLVTEGYMDVVALAQLGFAHAVATLGTACTGEHVHKLFRFTDAVVFSFDGDNAGRRAARKALDGALPYATDTRSIKFLFLPAEHDPDSFIRENGTEAFAAAVSQAVPLSRFLIDVAREGCELDSAEGRALLASHAKPLWQALPDGALKRQLLGELASLVDLDVRELSQLWAPIAPQTQPQHVPHRAPLRPSPSSRATPSRPAPRGKQALPTRIDHIARLMLTHGQLWLELSDAEHQLLCHSPEPQGPMFAWLESQLHEHGVMPWSALQENMAGQAFESYAHQLMSRQLHEIALDAGREDLQSALRELTLQFIQQETEALAAQIGQPGALERFKLLDERRKELKNRPHAAKN